MSIPRDLKVEIPGYGTGKFNEAYAYGGPKLTLQTVKQLTGLPINHVVNVDFLGFVRAVYAIGCVYTDVDRRYYHSNEGLSASEQYAEINVKPGYQLLCGKKALQYVRYRHTDTDIVRSSRQQDFISAARQRISVQDLRLSTRASLIEIFTKYTTSDISDKETMLDVLKLFLGSRNAAIKEVHFPAELGPSYVYATPDGDQRSGQPVPRDRSQRRRHATRKAWKKTNRTQAARRRATKKGKKARRSRRRSRSRSRSRRRPTNWCRPREAGETGGEDRRPPGRAAASRSSTRRGCRRVPPTSKATPTRRSSIPSSTSSRTRTATATRPTGWSLRVGTVRRHPLLRDAGDPGLDRSADPQQPEPKPRPSTAASTTSSPTAAGSS